MTARLRALNLRMIEFDRGKPDLIQHFTKVHAYAALIAECESMDAREREILEAAALVHDIAIPLCLEKYGNCAGPHQEQEGPALVREILPLLGFAPDETERVCWLVAHHHTVTNVQDLDHRILLEADFLVNVHEGNYSDSAKQKALESLFKTPTGIKLFKEMYLL